MMSKTALAIAAGAAAFFGYCVYFDHKRRNSPGYKKKVMERRRRAKESSSSTTKLPDMRDAEAMQSFFLSEIQQGEALLSMGDVEAGVEHLANAVTVCAQPTQLLQVFRQTLPPQIIALLMETLPKVQKRLAASAASSMPDLGSTRGPTITEETEKPSTQELAEEELE